ncbi:hypothetical protein STEG23_038375 [Scotinomys teguina]
MERTARQRPRLPASVSVQARPSRASVSGSAYSSPPGSLGGGSGRDSDREVRFRPGPRSISCERSEALSGFAMIALCAEPGDAAFVPVSLLTCVITSCPLQLSLCRKALETR